MKITLTAILLFITGCANYQIGDISKNYCSSYNADARKAFKSILKNQGVAVGVDYCMAKGFVDVMLVNKND